jgi:hypothetical protein
MNFFDVVNDLTQSKQHRYTDETGAAYQPFMVNRAMSNFLDCAMHANEMNLRANLTSRQQFDYYYYAIDTKKKRFAKWHKPEKDEQVKLVSEYYKCSLNLAEQYLTLLSENDLALIKGSLYRGGRTKI